MLIAVDGQDTDYKIVAVSGSAPMVDGSISVGEWDDAAAITFNTTEVFVKQDGKNLYIAFNVSDLTSHWNECVAAFFDVDQEDIIEFEVVRNGTLRERHLGNGISVKVTGWSANTQFSSELWQIEYNITYSKIGIVAGVEKTLGVILKISNLELPDYYQIWPQNLREYELLDDPSKWGVITSTGYSWSSMNFNLSQLFQWHACFFILLSVSFVVYFILFRYLWLREKSEKSFFPEEFVFERILGKKHYSLKVLIIGFICCFIVWIDTNEINSIFQPLTIPTGLFLLRKFFYEFKGTYEKYQNKDVVSKPWWNQVIKASKFHFNHWIVLTFVIWFFVIPASYFAYTYFGGLKTVVLLGAQYFFIGLATWVCGFGSYCIIYWFGKHLRLKPSAVYRDKFHGYEPLGNLTKWATLTIALIPGVGLPSVLDLSLILTSPPVQVALFWYTFAIITIFLWGIYNTHKGMTFLKKTRLKMLGKNITPEDEKILGVSDTKKKKTSNFLKLSTLQDSYKITNKMKEWPIDLSVVTEGLGSILFPILFTVVVQLILSYFGISA
jgi:hypothetical protein